MLNTLKRISLGAALLPAILVALLQAPLKGDVPPLFAAGLTLASCFILWLPGFALSAILRFESAVDTICAFVMGCGLAGAMLFIGWFIGRPVGLAIEVLIATGSIAVIASYPVPVRDLKRPAFLAIVAAVLYIAIAADHGGMIHANARVAYRYWDGPDNVIPQFFTDAILKGRQYLTPTLPGMGDWQASDRPPLLTGMMLSAYPFVADTQRDALALTLGIAANVLWVFGLWAFLRAIRVRENVASFVSVLVILSGPVYMNTVYVWPKMLAGAFVLCAGAMLATRGPVTKLRAIIIGACVALGMLSHGAIIFGVFGLIPLFVTNRRHWNARLIVICAVSSVVLYAPWMAYQKYFDPPGDRLVKWHLANLHEISPEKPLEAIVGSYRALSARELWTNKLNNLRMIVGVFPLPDTIQPGWRDNTAGEIRRHQSTSVGISALFGIAGLLLLFRRRHEEWFSPLLKVIVSSTLAYVLIEFGGSYWAIAWLHTAPYSLLLLWVALGPLLVADSPMLSRAMLTASTAAFVWVWIVAAGRLSYHGTGMGHTDGAMTAVQVVCIIALVWKAIVWSRRQTAAAPIKYRQDTRGELASVALHRRSEH
ncbi:hypothetical protein AB4Y42_34365 [Paraburkholderia sp. EG286B]|uniref:hypothetical protein n=1 Tax=Paraburkholderia sp. EG286B TaxID=3237011 RepID=UPI0034D1608F